MIKIACPHCQHRLALQTPKAGRFQPKCPKCGERFLLTVLADADQAPIVQKIETSAPIVSEKTVAEPPADQTAQFSRAPGGEETLAQEASPPNVAGRAPAPAVDATRAEATAAGVNTAGDATLAMPTGGEPQKASNVAAEATTAGTAFGVAPGTATRADATIAHKAAAATAVDPDGPAGAAARPLPEAIGGYKIVKQLGHGAMGDVYLARQISLDRDVALKTIRPQWASNPAFIARFTREAYAAAQLTHHNVVQIYDLGVDGDFHFFSMEYVRGEALDQILKREGPLAPRVAAGYVLQAARGLLFAHQYGMVHRDVKPANLMLNDQGLVKVADLGLVKVPVSGSEVPPAIDAVSAGGSSLGAGGSHRSAMLQSSLSGTLTHFAVGTPAYMPPEQVDDAANVDHRADIYSLGCTLYALLAGRSPFDGASVMEMLDKHRHQRIELPTAVRDKTPGELLSIVDRMTAKRPADRYADLQQVIVDLERYLNGPGHDARPFRPEDADELEQAYREFNGAPGKTFRRLATWAAIGGGGLALLALPLSFRLSLGTVAWLAGTVAAYGVIAGVRDRTYLAQKFRQAAGALKWGDWASIAVGGLALAALLLLTLGVVGAAVVAVLAAATAWGAHEAIDRRLARQRAGAIERLERLLKHRRLAGVDESALRQFVAQHAGVEWEEGFEQLFGYEALVGAREAWGQDAQGRPRPRFRPWRDALVRSLDARIQSVRDAKTRKVLAKVEAQQLVAQGVAPAAARQQAAAMADGLVQQAASARTLADEVSAKAADPRAAAELKRQRIKAMLATARSGQADASQRGASTSLTGLLLAPLKGIWGARARFLLGCLLLVGGLWWAHQNGLLSRSTLDQAKTAAAEAKSGRLLAVLDLAFPVESQPLPLPIVGRLFSSIVPGVAGAVLIVLSLGRGWKWPVGSAISAGLMLFGPSLGVPGIQALGGPEATCLVLGLTVAVGTFFSPIGRR
ncbi:MAG: serine/threonine-protein kinase [Pirellulales bacterium]